MIFPFLISSRQELFGKIETPKSRRIRSLIVATLSSYIETITSVGYGDLTPKTVNEKAITMVLIFLGVFMFSTVTAVISSFFTDQLINDEKIEEDLEVVKKELDTVQKQNTDLKNELNVLKSQNDVLISEINELKELIKK